MARIETPKQRERRLNKYKKSNQKRKIAETPEQKEKKKKYYQKRKVAEIPEQKEERLKKQREVYKQKTKENRKKLIDKVRLKQQNKLANESNEQRKMRLEDLKDRQTNRKENESDEQRKKRLKIDKEKHSQHRENESDEQHKIRLGIERERQSQRLKNETIKEKNQRLEERRKQIMIKAADLNNFENTINVFCELTCNICLKQCYPNQTRKHYLIPDKIPHYLPVKLSNKSVLLFCTRCKTHITSSKATPPSKSYWNNLDPGRIPNEIYILSHVEQRLLSRVIPFVKIVKYSGRYGQYGFKGQAILFAQDIFEVTENLPNMLPRSPENASIVVVTEELENLNITREFRISRDRLNSALNWLIKNNPLYKDVQNISETVDIRIENIIKTQDANELDEEENESSFVPINNESRISRASYNQSNTLFFNAEYAGVQCAAISLSVIVKSCLLPVAEWSTNTYNQVMIHGDGLYEMIRFLSDEKNIPIENGYLYVSNFNVIRNDFILFDNSFSLQYDQDPELYGNLDDRVNRKNGTGMNLSNSLLQLFEKHKAGILISGGKSFAVLKQKQKFYFADSHSCGPKGAPSGKGKACVIECDTFNEFHRIIRRATGSRNAQYTLDFIEVTVKNDIRKMIQYDENNHGQIEDIPVQTSVCLPVDCEQPREESVLEQVPRHGKELDLNKIKRKTKDNIVNEAYELKAEEYAWFYLLPHGINGLKENRLVPITPLDYYQARILGKDTRFQRNDYLFYALSMYEYYRVKSNLSVCGKKIQHRGDMVEDVYMYVKNLRGSAAYWNTALNELIAQIKCLGPPHYFITLSCNDLHWPDMIKALLKADESKNQDPTKLNVFEVQRLVEKYPVTVSRHFMRRLNSFMTYIYANEELFLGKIVDHWWRIEFQNRGSPHVHMVIWVQGTPDFESEKGVERIDELITCEIPEDDQELAEIVKGVQVHHHTPTCYKESSDCCRFNFPRKPCEKTRILQQTSNDFIVNGGRLYELKRISSEQFVNNYHPSILKMWKGNMDIQPCGNDENIAMYISKYVAKAESKELSTELRNAINKIKREEGYVPRKLFKICMTLLNKRQVSATECVFRLCHLNLRSSSRKCEFINTRKPDERYRVLAFGNDDKASGFCSNMIDRYEKRPMKHANYDFDNMCLMEFAMLFEPYYASRKDGMSDESCDADAYGESEAETKTKLITLTDKSKMRIRTRPAVVRAPYFRENTDPENYYYSLLAQYQPFRDESELMTGFKTSKDSFLAKEVKLRASCEMMDAHRNRDREIQNAFDQAHAFQELDNVDNVELIDEEEELAECLQNIVMSESDFESAKKAMNLGQRELFNFITSSIRNQLSGNKERIRLFVTGGAGTGKTFTLKVAKEQIRRCYGSNKTVVKVCALTGAAAKLIDGATIHSTLKLPVQKDGRILNLPMLTGEYLKQMRLQWRDIEFFIIDEISMVPYEMLCMIDSRLKQLKDSETLFGGLNIIFFGDLMQLPPIRGNPIFKQPTRMEPATHLWRVFSFCELTQNMRQQGDNTFVDLLNNLRVGKLTKENIDILIIKQENNTTGDFALGKALRVHPTINLVDDHNRKVLEKFEEEKVQMFVIQAQDKIVDSKKSLDEVHIDKLIPKDINKTGGFPKELTLFAGARVMLRCNLDISKGLVNGSIGHVTEIIWPLFRRAQVYKEDIPEVNIDFGDTGIHNIKPKTVQFPAKLSYGIAERRMLPLILCWSSTVHKMQGTTVDKAVINLGPKLFAPGQAYVALSRVRSLEGLRLEDLCCDKLLSGTICNQAALEEMERLRKLPSYISDQSVQEFIGNENTNVILIPKKENIETAVSNPKKITMKDLEKNEIKIKSTVAKSSENASLKNPKHRVNEMSNNEIDRQANSFAIFPNTINTKASEEFYFMCPFNSLIHGMLSLVKTNHFLLQQCLSRNTEFFKCLIEITMLTDNSAQIERWIKYIKSTKYYKLNVRQKYNMENEINEVAQELFKSHESCVVECLCCNINCQKLTKRPYVITSALAPADDLRDVKNLMLNRMKSSYASQKCSVCSEKFEISFKFGDLILISIHRQTKDLREEALFKNLTFAGIANEFEHDGETYDFQFLIHRILGGIKHFVCYCKIRDNIWYLNDFGEFGPVEEIVNDPMNKLINPVVLVYLNRK